MATVIVWENNMSGRNGTRRTWAGHASLCLTDQWDGGAANRLDHYVSWWPDVEKFGVRQGAPKLDIVEDIKREGYAPDWIIRLPEDRIDLPKMKTAWQHERGQALGGGLRDQEYRFITRNCATIVARVMMAGGLMPHRRPQVWSPVRVKEFAEQVGGTRMTWDELKVEMRACGLKDYNRTNGQGEIIDFARDAAFSGSQAIPKFDRGRRAGVCFNSAGEAVLRVQPLDIYEN